MNGLFKVNACPIFTLIGRIKC